MSIENFFTAQNLFLPTPAQGAGKDLGASGTPAQGVSFLDFILAQINQASEETAPGIQEQPHHEDKGALQSNNKLLEKKPELNVAELLAANPEIENEIKDFAESTGLPPEDVLTQVLALNQQAFDNTLKPLTDGIITAEEIAKGSPRILQALLIEDANPEDEFRFNINLLKQKIESIIEDGDIDLSALNLTPEQIDIVKNLQDREALPEDLQGNPFLTIIQMVAPTNRTTSEAGKSPVTADITEISNDPVLQNLIATLLPPVAQGQPKADAATTAPPANAFDVTLPEQASQRAHEQMQLLAGRLNSLAPEAGTAQTGEGEPLFTIEDYDGNLHAAQDGNGKAKGPHNHAFEALMNAGAKGKASPAPSMDLSILQNWPFPAGSTLFSASEYGSGFSDQYGLNTASSAPTTLGTLTSMITQASNAQAAHPATQMVAATLQKGAGNGENKTLTLQLDPPELGRVQVKMTFGADKKIKAVLLSEKPETHMMLQRDAQTLERALQGVDLDSDGGLSFELAEHGFDFDQGNQRGGGHDAGGTGAGGESGEEIELIESTMTWQIDPETGHARYDIVA